MSDRGSTDEQRIVIKDEPEALVEVLGSGSAAVVRKVYRNRGLRWWQSFGRRSRAEREFQNLQLVEASGIECTGPVSWSATTRLGFVTASELVTRYLPDSVTLKSVLADGSPATWQERRSLARATGHLIGRLHRSGFLWCTPMPRNTLVLGKPADAQLAVCDTPQGIGLPASVHASKLALIDLFDAAFSKSRRRDYSASNRMRWLLGYCDGNRVTARQLWRAISRRSVLRHDVSRALTVFWFVYILRPLRGLRSRLRSKNARTT